MKLVSIVAIALAALLAIAGGVVITVLILNGGLSGRLNGEQKAPAATFHLLPVTEVTKAPCASGFMVATDGSECYRVQPGMTNIRADEVNAAQGQTGGWLIQVTLDHADGQAFSELTSRLHREPEPRNRLAIVIDGKVLSAPTIMSPIPGGSLEISGTFTRQEATELAERLGGN